MDSFKNEILIPVREGEEVATVPLLRFLIESLAPQSVSFAILWHIFEAIPRCPIELKAMVERGYERNLPVGLSDVCGMR